MSRNNFRCYVGPICFFNDIFKAPNSPLLKESTWEEDTLDNTASSRILILVSVGKWLACSNNRVKGGLCRGSVLKRVFKVSKLKESYNLIF